MQIEIEKLNVDYICDGCQVFKGKVPLEEVLNTGNPMCSDCDTEMIPLGANLEMMEGIEG